MLLLYFILALGNLAFNPYRGNVSFIHDCFFAGREISQLSPAVQEFWIRLFRCIDLSFNKSVLSLFGSEEEHIHLSECKTNFIQDRTIDPSCLCTGHELQASLAPDLFIGYLADAVLAVALSLDRIISNCSSIRSFNICGRTNITGLDLYAVMSEFPFDGVTGRVAFDGVNRICGSYDIIQFTNNGNMSTVGQYQENGFGLMLNESALSFRSNQQTTSRLDPGDQLQTAIGAIVVAIAICIILCSLVFIVFFYRHRHDRNIKRSSPLFNQLILVGIIFICAGLIVWTPLQSQATCIVKIWLSAVGFCLIVCSILVKTYRINKIFHAKVRYVSLSDFELIKFGAPLLLIEITLLLVYTLADGLPQATLVVGRAPQIFSYTICTTANATFQDILTAAIISYNFLLVIITAVLAYQARHVIKEYNESAFIAYLVYIYTILAVITLAIYFDAGMSPSAPNIQYYSRSVGAIIALLATIVFLFLPKMPALERRMTNRGVISAGGFSQDEGSLFSSEDHCQHYVVRFTETVSSESFSSYSSSASSRTTINTAKERRRRT